MKSTTPFKGKLLLPLIAASVFLIPRLYALDQHTATDEPAWLTRGGNFYYAVARREFENTIYEYHPSVPTMWYGAMAVFLIFPEYRGLGQGYFDVDKDTFDPFLISHGIQPMQILHLARVFQILALTVTLLVLYYLLKHAFGKRIAFLVTCLAPGAPFLLGHSRTLSHEAMTAFFVITSLFAFWLYLEREAKWQYLLISGVYAGLAQVTKSSAIAMMPAIGLMLLVSFLKNRKAEKSLQNYLMTAAVWFAALCAIYWLIWPGMWVNPAKMLGAVYGNAFSYTFEGTRIEAIQQNPAQPPPNQGTFAEALASFGLALLNKSTAVSLSGFILLIVFLRTQKAKEAGIPSISLYLAVTAAAFILMFSIARGRNSGHYIMTSHVSIDIMAALGWSLFLEYIIRKISLPANFTWYAATATLCAVQLFAALPFFPYYYNYYNPALAAVTGRTPLSDYGEGFEKAAQYLAAKPNAQDLTVYAHRGRGPFSFFFPGRTMTINPILLEEPGMPSFIERVNLSDYLVINDAFIERTPRTHLLAAALQGVTPEETITTKGAYTIYIYRVKDLPPSFYQTLEQ